MSAIDPSQEGFLHDGRIVYAVKYELAGGSSLIVWLDRAGNDLNGYTRHGDPKRRIVTAKPGDVILHRGQPRTVESVEAYRQNWLSAEDRAKHARLGGQPLE